MTILQRFLRLLPVCVLGCMPLGAFAGEMAVTGSAQTTYSTSSEEVMGNPYGLDTVLTFAASGELDNGHTWSYSMELDPADVTSDALSLGVGTSCANEYTATTSDDTYKSGTGMVSPTTGPAAVNAGCIFDDHRLTIGGGFDGVDLSTIDDMTPNAYEEAGGGVGGDGGTIGVAGVDGWDLGASYSPGAVDSGGGATDFAVTYTGVEGLSVSYGAGEATAAGDDEGSNEFSLAFNVNDDLSVSYAEDSADTGADGDGLDAIQVAYTMGGMSIKAYQVETVSATANNGDETTEIAFSGGF